jgi:hypothetical protein
MPGLISRHDEGHGSGCEQASQKYAERLSNAHEIKMKDGLQRTCTYHFPLIAD